MFIVRIIVDLLIYTLAVIATAYLLPGVHVANLESAVITAVVLAVVNTFIRPVIVLITLPLTILTLGFFILVINTLLILFVDWIVDGFSVDGFFTAFVFSIILWIVNWALNAIESRIFGD